MKTEDKELQNPSAFPVMATEQTFFNQNPLMPESGMTLRDYFAGKAISGVMANEHYGFGSKEGYAEWAYEMADAMLKERLK